MAVKKQANKVGSLRAVKEALKNFRDSREEAKRIDAFVKEVQPEIIQMLKEIDPDGNGIVYDDSDKSKGAAYVQQNSGSEVWDHEEIIEYLRRNKARWMSCSSRVFDVQKWEAEIANGNIPKKTAQKFLKKQPDPKPFIRFGKIQDGSL